MAGDVSADVVWHDAECGGYGADLGLWEELAAAANGPLLDLGCGTGRVALHLARRGHQVVAVDREPALVAALEERADGLPVRGVVGDARALDLGQRFPLILAPMQLVQLLVDAEERSACLRGIAAHLTPGGIAALAIVESVAEEDVSSLSRYTGQTRQEEVPLPDTREVDGTVYSSLPLPTELADDAILVRRLRQTVAPDGRLAEEEDTVRLRPLGAAGLEGEARAVGLEPLRRRSVAPTDDHVGSTVVVLRKGVA
ncbi:MAG TPA: class I SAM-dependent methyltransferase [Solirubrobacterales bacterium]|nr:class I SAM-dependent methyltransferase [Solirubrobacterales bacterium]